MRAPAGSAAAPLGRRPRGTAAAAAAAPRRQSSALGALSGIRSQHGAIWTASGAAACAVAAGLALCACLFGSCPRVLWQCPVHVCAPTPLLSEFNPLPTVILVGNMCCWSIYAALSRDPYLTVAASVG